MAHKANYERMIQADALSREQLSMVEDHSQKRFSFALGM